MTDERGPDDATPPAGPMMDPADSFLRARWEQAISEYEAIVTALGWSIGWVQQLLNSRRPGRENS
jgi:hypothetical protein